jgi:hypothetical protein
MRNPTITRRWAIHGTLNSFNTNLGIYLLIKDDECLDEGYQEPFDQLLYNR